MAIRVLLTWKKNPEQMKQIFMELIFMSRQVNKLSCYLPSIGFTLILAPVSPSLSLCLYIYIYIYIYIVVSPNREYKYFKIGRSTKRFVFFECIYLFCSYIRVCFQLLAFAREHIWHKVWLMGYSMRLEITCVCSLNDFLLVIGFYRGLPLFFLVCV